MEGKHNDKGFKELCNRVAYFNDILKRNDRVELTVLPNYGVLAYDLKVKNQYGGTIVNGEDTNLHSLSCSAVLEYEYIVKHPHRKTIASRDVSKTYLAYYMDSSEPERIMVISEHYFDNTPHYHIYLVDDKSHDIYRYNEWSLLTEIVGE